jgi:hypothetical protein
LPGNSSGGMHAPAAIAPSSGTIAPARPPARLRGSARRQGSSGRAPMRRINPRAAIGTSGSRSGGRRCGAPPP